MQTNSMCMHPPYSPNLSSPTRVPRVWPLLSFIFLREPSQTPGWALLCSCCESVFAIMHPRGKVGLATHENTPQLVPLVPPRPAGDGDAACGPNRSAGPELTRRCHQRRASAPPTIAESPGRTSCLPLPRPWLRAWPTTSFLFGQPWPVYQSCRQVSWYPRGCSTQCLCTALLLCCTVKLWPGDLGSWVSYITKAV